MTALAPGRYRVVVETNDGKRDTTEVEVAAAEVTVRVECRKPD